MTKDIRLDQGLDHLAQALIDDALDTPDAEFLAEMKEDGEDVDKISRDVGNIFELAKRQVAAEKMDAAKECVKAYRDSTSSIIEFTNAAVRERFEALTISRPDLAPHLTMAARNGGALSDRDIQSIMDDLEFLERSLLNEKKVEE